MSKYYRSAPFQLSGNPVIKLMQESLSYRGWVSKEFAHWKVWPLILHRRKVRIIHYHWPEAFWRSRFFLVQLLKVVHFILLYYFSRFLGYKFVWSAHNVFPHYRVCSDKLEKVMRTFIIAKFDFIIGHSINTLDDLMGTFDFNAQNYRLVIHPLYENIYPIHYSKRDIYKDWQLPINKKTILLINSDNRKNKGVSELLDGWNQMLENPDVVLILIGFLPSDYHVLQSRQDFRYIQGRIDDSLMGSYLNAVDFLFLNYQNITTSGLYFLALTFNLPVIAPDLPFFKAHTTTDTAIVFDRTKTTIKILEYCLNIIKSGWGANEDVFNELKRKSALVEFGKGIEEVYDLCYEK